MTIDELLQRADRSSNGCMVWRVAKDAHGYGRSGKTVAHRLAWQAAHGPIPKGLFVLHSCDNPPCINPDHLHLGTQFDNMQEMVARGRMSERAKMNIVGRIGERAPRAKLTEAQVSEIRRRRANGERGRRLAAEFGVKEQAICDIVKGRNWRHSVPASGR